MWVILNVFLFFIFLVFFLIFFVFFLIFLLPVLLNTFMLELVSLIGSVQIQGCNDSTGRCIFRLVTRIQTVPEGNRIKIKA